MEDENKNNEMKQEVVEREIVKEEPPSISDVESEKEANNSVCETPEPIESRKIDLKYAAIAILSIILLFSLVSFSTAKSKLGDTEKTIEQLNKENSKLKSDVSKLETDIHTYEENNKNLISENSSIKKEYSEYKEKMKKYEEVEKEEEEHREAVGYDTGITYDQLARTPDDYKGEKVKFTGKVIQVIEGDYSIQIRLAVNDDYDTILLGEYFPSIVSSRILKDDEITIYGTSRGIITYKSTLGGNITIPSVHINQIDQ